MTKTRIEHDLLGDREIPADAYWGVHTLRAVENFPISGQPIGAIPELVRALAAVKQAAALANADLGLLSPERSKAIVAACEEIRAGKLHDQFVVDQIQGGAGTSTNMNANEVIANRALELMGHAKGEYQYLHPNEHLNMSQSTNDVYPTALRLASWKGLQKLIGALANLRGAFAVKSVEFHDILKMGRTQLQEAVPMTLGQEFNTYAVMIGEDEARLAEVSQLVCEINLPAKQAGSSIMPGKVNPVIPEVVNQICFEVIGNDMTIAMAAEGGQLQLNAFEPVIAYSLFRSVDHLVAGCATLQTNCVEGITANRDVLKETVRRSIGIVTALNPYIGYAAATEVATEAHLTGRGVYELVLEKGLLPKDRLDEILRPENLTKPQLFLN